jgi:phosphatidylserine/phosphatidylglycerophosphate/cardiolipin synthase-like enzyme
MSQNWFLPKSTNNTDDWCFEIGDSDVIKFYFTYEDYFKSIHSLINSLCENDEIFMVGWVFDMNLPLVQNGKTCIQMLREAYARGAIIRFLCNGTSPDSPISRGLVNKIPKSIKVGKGIKTHNPIALHDTNIKSDHHQKAVHVKRNGKDILFLGGMDITNDANSKKKTYRKWFDIQVKLEGSASILGKRTLEERWSSVLLNSKIEISAPLTSVPEIGKNTGNGNFKFQFVRSYPVAESGQQYALQGDFTYYLLVRNAIKEAKSSIYFEDQFFQPMGNNGIERNYNPKLTNDIKRNDLPYNAKTLDSLLKDASLSKKVKILGIGSDFFYPNGEQNNNIALISKKKNSRFAGGLNTLFRESSNASGIKLLGSLYKAPLKSYMHSKIWIFDDAFAIVGSGNYWLHSFLPQSGNTLNLRSEFGVGILPKKGLMADVFGFPEVPFIKGLRLKLWERLRVEVTPGYKFPTEKISDFETEFNLVSKISKDEEIFVTPS